MMKNRKQQNIIAAVFARKFAQLKTFFVLLFSAVTFLLRLYFAVSHRESEGKREKRRRAGWGPSEGKFQQVCKAEKNGKGSRELF